MDKRLILAVAGSGKTTYLVDRLDLERRFLIVTHTNNNFSNIRSKLVTKFGYVPSNIKVFTYFSFLYGFCFRPFLAKVTGVKGLNFKPCPDLYARDLGRYIDYSGRAYSNRLAKLILVKGADKEVTSRINRYFDVVMIDEIQDFAANDFNFLPTITKSRTDTIFVGDFFQHTFDTSRDGNVAKNLHKDYQKYVQHFVDMGLEVDKYTLNNSHRCSPLVCDYITSKLRIDIKSHRTDSTFIRLLEEADEIQQVYENNLIVKLFFDGSSNWQCNAQNWGASKGEDKYGDVCVVLNPTSFANYRKGNLWDLAPGTRNKLYVAITRARGDIYFVEEKALDRAIK